MTLDKNEKEVAPVNIWQNGSVKIATIFKIDNFYGYDFVASAGYIHWSILEYDVLTDTKNILVEGQMPMIFPVIEDWGRDDQIIFDYVAAQLNLTLV